MKRKREHESERSGFKMEISKFLPTKIVRSFEYSNDQYISIEFISGEYFYILTDDCSLDKLYIKKFDFTGKLVLNSSFYVDYEISINSLDCYVISDDKIYGIFNRNIGTYLAMIDLKAETGQTLSFLRESWFYGCNIVCHEEYVMIFGGVERIRVCEESEIENSTEHIFIYNSREDSIRTKYIELLLRKNALAYVEDSRVMIKYGYDSNNLFIDFIETFDFDEVKDDINFISVDIIFPKFRMRDKLREISDISYAGDFSKMYVLFRKRCTHYLYVETEDRFIKLDSTLLSISLLKKTEDCLVLSMEENVLFLREQPPSLKNFMAKYINSNHLTYYSYSGFQKMDDKIFPEKLPKNLRVFPKYTIVSCYSTLEIDDIRKPEIFGCGYRPKSCMWFSFGGAYVERLEEIFKGENLFNKLYSVEFKDNCFTDSLNAKDKILEIKTLGKYVEFYKRFWNTEHETLDWDSVAESYSGVCFAISVPDSFDSIYPYNIRYDAMKRGSIGGYIWNKNLIDSVVYLGEI